MDAERNSQESQVKRRAAALIAAPSETPGADSADFHFVEIGHYTRPDKQSQALEPAVFRFGGVEGLGRGVFIDVAEVPRFAEQYKSQAWGSHFRYNSNESDIIGAALSEGSLEVAGDFFFVFNAATSAEIVHAINQTIDLVERLKEQYDVPYEAVMVYFAGRDLEVHVDAAVFGATPGPRLPEIYRRMTRALLDLDPLGADAPIERGQVDFSVYRADYMSPLPGTLTNSDTRETYKIRLGYGAFKKLSYQRLNEFSHSLPELREREPWSLPAPRARDFFLEISEGLKKSARSEKDAIATMFYGTTAAENSAASLKQLAPALLRRLFDEQRQFIPTPSPQLNGVLAGGLHPGDLYVLAAFPGSGTSTLAVQLMNHAVMESGAHCIFAGLQRGVEEQFKRSLASIGRIPISEIDKRRQNPRELYDDKDFSQRIFQAYERYMKVADRITVLEGGAAASVSRLAELVRERKEQQRQHGDHGKILLVIDSLQLMLAVLRTNSAVGGEGQELEASATRAELDIQMLTSRLKALARELDIVVLATLEYYDQRLCGIGADGIAGPERGASMAQLFHDTQFADTLMMLNRLGTSLEPLRHFYASGGGSANGEAELWQKRLTQLEDGRRQTPEFKHLDAEFCVLDLLKNRSGPSDKILLVMHKPFATFEPLDYKG